jgi:hypothetical protein
MSQRTTSPFGTSTEHHLAELDRLAKQYRNATVAADEARLALGAQLRLLLHEYDAQRRALAARLAVHDQTVTNLAYGRRARSTAGTGR